MELGPTTAVIGALEGLLVVDRAGLFTYANPAAERLLGAPSTQIVHSSARAWRVTTLDGQPLAVEDVPVLRLLRTGESVAYGEHALHRADKSEVFLSHTATLIRGESGAIEGAVVSLVDITERRRVADRVKKAEFGVRAFIERSPNGIAMHRNGRLVFANAGMYEKLGYTAADDLIGRSVLDFIHPDDRAMVRDRIHAMEHEGRDVPVLEERMLHKNGSIVEVETSALPIIFEGEHTILAIVVDVSEQRRVRRELDRSLSLLRATLESTADGILVVDEGGKIAAYNEKFVEMWRIPRELIERRDDDVAIAHVLGQLEDPAGFVGKMRELYAEPAAESRDMLKLKDGRCFQRYSQAQRIDGKCVGRVWSFLDITLQRRAESDRERLLAEVDAKRQLLQTVIDHAPVGIALVRGPEHVYELVNREYESMFGRQLWAGRRVADALAAPSERLIPILADVLRTGRSFRAVDMPYFVQRSPEGPVEEAYYWLHLMRVPSPTGDAVLGLVVETTEQVNARRRIEDLAKVSQRQTAELESIYASMADGVVVCDAAGRVTLLNDASVRLTGLTRETARGRTLEEYAGLLGYVHIDGSTMPAGELPIARALAGETVASVPLRSERMGRKVYVRTSATPLRNEHGTIVGAVAVDHDVSEMVEFDLLKDQFIRVAAHELKTPIAIMKGYAQLLLRTADTLPAPMAGSLAAIDRGANRIDSLVNDLLDLSQLQLGRLELRHEKIDLPELVDVVRRRVELTTKAHRIRVTNADPVVIRGDRARLEQVLSNLLDNAIRYSPRGGDIEVSVTLRDGAAEVAVSDHGVGIPAEKQARMFQCFYRAHTDTPYDYGGMGVGLYISREIVAGHGGAMWFESKEGSGSMFAFRLPV